MTATVQCSDNNGDCRSRGERCVASRRGYVQRRRGGESSTSSSETDADLSDACSSETSGRKTTYSLIGLEPYATFMPPCDGALPNRRPIAS